LVAHTEVLITNTAKNLINLKLNYSKIK
jgi:hypothetical protein